MFVVTINIPALIICHTKGLNWLGLVDSLVIIQNINYSELLEFQDMKWLGFLDTSLKINRYVNDLFLTFLSYKILLMVNFYNFRIRLNRADVPMDI